VAAKLRERGVHAEHYHAGLDAGSRARVQEQWMADEVKVCQAGLQPQTS